MVDARSGRYIRFENEWDQKLPVLALNRPSGKRRFRRQHPDDRIWLAVQPNRAPDDARISAEAPLPQLMSDDNHLVVAPRSVLVGRKSATERRLQPQNLKITRRDHQSTDALRLPLAGEIHLRSVNQ